MDSERIVTRRSLLVSLILISTISLLLFTNLGILGAEQNHGLDEEPLTYSNSIENISDIDISEEPFIQEAPEEGDEYFEAKGEGTNGWISYINPRDEYRGQISTHQPGSGKVCISLLNERKQPVLGKSLENTTVSIEFGQSLDWHNHTNPFEVDFPLNENYERPLDADQFGTSSDVPQGDGYMDSHCIEWHEIPEEDTITYQDPEILGENSTDIEVLGIIEQDAQSWNTDLQIPSDLSDYESEEVTGELLKHDEHQHGQATIVLTLDN